MFIRFYVNLISFFELTCISMRISSIINLSDTISMAILCSCYMLDFLFYHVIGKESIVWKQGVVLLIFLFELEISGMAVQGIHQNSKKWLFSVRNFFVKISLRVFYPFLLF